MRPSALPGFLRRHAVRALAFLANFGLSKAAAFLGPLLLAQLLTPDVYGAIEFAWSAGLFAAAGLSLGLPGALPQLMLSRQPVPMADILAWSVMIPGTAAIVAALTALFMGGASTAPFVLVAACTVVALMQGAMASYARTLSYRNASVWFESAAIHVMVLIACILVAARNDALLPIAIGSLFVATATVAAALLAGINERAPAPRLRLRLALSRGLPLLAYSLCGIWLAVSGRIFIGTTLSAADVAAFAVCWRVASAVLLIHAVLATGLFARLYTMKTRSYDLYLSSYYLVIGTFCVGLIVMFPIALSLMPVRALPAPEIAVAIFPVVVLQVFAWLASASLEMRVNRARLAGSAAWQTAAVAVVTTSAVAILAFADAVTLPRLAWLVAGQMAGSVAVQFAALWQRGLKMPKSLAATVMVMVVLVAVGAMRT